MIIIDPSPLERTIAALLQRVEDLPYGDDEALPVSYEKFAKAISTQIKAVQDIYAHNERVAAHEKQTKYLSYDELPPPSPEERAQFIARLTNLYNRLNERSEIQGFDEPSERSLRGRVKSRHVDFLITTPQGQPLMMIELDGSSHQSKSAQRPDDLKNGLADAVGLPLRRIRVGQDFHKFAAKVQAELPSY